ncbi:MAG: ABC transporter permease [Ignisphaera sp.]|nr:ABC transporter permease [Ignisphaera sp.]MCX8167853.1 ABC transporter permease [Ignisphaera sp.]MDW8086127.1 ABC transporter permease [Ignisphaera sp.]
MHPVARYILQRGSLALLVVWIGLTVTFVVSRLMPFNAAELLISRLISQGVALTGEEIEAMKKQLLELYGLDKPVVEQYLVFLRNYMVTGEMGPSFAFFPTSVRDVISKALPWSLLLLIMASVVSWFIGNGIGILAALTKRRRISNILENVAIAFQPIPFAVLAISFLIFYALVLKLPIPSGGYMITGSPVEMLLYMSRRAAFPLMILVMFGWFGSFVSMKAVALKMREEDFIIYSFLQGAPTGSIRYMIFRNSILPQFTILVLGLSRVFIGSLLVEYIFNYPGIGYILQGAIANADYNLMLGVLFFATIATAVATFILDLVYPLIDPRIRYPGQG